MGGRNYLFPSQAPTRAFGRNSWHGRPRCARYDNTSLMVPPYCAVRRGPRTMRPESRIQYSVVIPVFNEEAVIPLLLRRLDQLLDQFDAPAEVIFVDDGSSDCSGIVLRAKAKDD